MSALPELDPLRECLLEVVPDLPDDTSADLFASHVIDSLRLLEIVMALEARFGVEFSPEQMKTERFATLEAILATLRDLLE